MIEHFYQTIPGWFDYQELYSSMVERFPSGSKFVEVGVYLGSSLGYLVTEVVNSGKDIEVYGVDTFVYDQQQEWVGNNLIKVSGKFKLIKSDSTKAADLFENSSLDFVFIDACHEYDSVVSDIRAYLPKMKAGGVIAGHDYNPVHYPGVCKAVQEVFGSRFVLEKASWKTTWVVYL